MFDPTIDTPETDGEVLQIFAEIANGHTELERAMVGSYTCSREMGLSLLEAFERVLRIFVDGEAN